MNSNFLRQIYTMLHVQDYIRRDEFMHNYDKRHDAYVPHDVERLSISSRTLIIYEKI